MKSPDNTARPQLDWSGNAPFPFTRESSIRLDAEGRFFHEGNPVEHAGLSRAMSSWISRHPDNGRWVLENGYDWCYVTIEDVPFWLKSARVEGSAIIGTLTDGSEEQIDPTSLAFDDAGTIRCAVKANARKGPYPAKLARHAQLAVSEKLREDGDAFVLALPSGDIRLKRS